jgi:hypothetical protein
LIVEHTALEKFKLVFLHTGKEILSTYKKRWNIEQGYKDLRNLLLLGKKENRIYE